MHNTPNLLLWTDTPGPYIDAIRQAGLAERVAIETLARKETPSVTQRQQTHALLAGACPGRAVADDAQSSMGAIADRRRGGLAGAAGPARPP